MMSERGEPLLECEYFKMFTGKPMYKVKVKRKNPYYKIAKLLQALHTEFKQL